MKLLDLFFAARPLLQLPIWTVYLVSLHYHHATTGESFGGLDLFIMAAISFLFAGAAYLNQFYDEESDRLNNKIGFLQKGYLRAAHLKAGFAIASIIPLAVAPFISMFTLIVFAQFLLLSYFYSAPPVRMKDRPLAGLSANAYGHGLLVAVAVAHRLDLSALDVLDWTIPAYFALTVGATYILTTIPDRKGDRATGKCTIAVVLGRTWALVIALVILLVSVIVAYRSAHALLTYLAIGAMFLVAAALMVRTEPAVRFASKMPLLVLTIVAGAFYPIYLAFVVALLIGTRAYYFQRFGIVYPELA